MACAALTKAELLTVASGSNEADCPVGPSRRRIFRDQSARNEDRRGLGPAKPWLSGLAAGGGADVGIGRCHICLPGRAGRHGGWWRGRRRLPRFWRPRQLSVAAWAASCAGWDVFDARGRADMVGAAHSQHHRRLSGIWAICGSFMPCGVGSAWRAIPCPYLRHRPSDWSQCQPFWLSALGRCFARRQSGGRTGGVRRGSRPQPRRNLAGWRLPLRHALAARPGSAFC